MNSEAKYSLDVLPDDNWETRRTKQVVRAIVRAKNERNLTTEALAIGCSKFMGKEDSIRTATLNGVFAGKRKSISMTELEMFAEVLRVPVLDLLYPAGEEVEVRPGRYLSSANAIVQDMLMPLPTSGGPTYLGSRVEAIIRVIRDASAVAEDTASAIWAIRVNPAQTELKLLRLGLRIRAFHTSRRLLKEYGESAPELPDTATWVIGVDVDDITPEVLLSLEPMFKGISIGDYHLGGGPERVERQKEN